MNSYWWRIICLLYYYNAFLIAADLRRNWLKNQLNQVWKQPQSQLNKFHSTPPPHFSRVCFVFNVKVHSKWKCCLHVLTPVSLHNFLFCRTQMWIYYFFPPSVMKVNEAAKKWSVQLVHQIPSLLYERNRFKFTLAQIFLTNCLIQFNQSK